MMKKTPANPNAQSEVFRFFAAAIKGNVYRTKLSAQLENEPEHLKSYCSDAFSIVLYDVLLELTKKILQSENLLAKIQFEFLDSITDEFKFEELDYFSEGAAQHKISLAAPGSVSKFFFYTLTATHYHFTQTSKYFQKLNENYRRMEKDMKHLSPTDTNYAAMQKHYLKSKQRLIVYKLIMDWNDRNILVHKLFNHFLKMILDKFSFANIPAPEDLDNAIG